MQCAYVYLSNHRNNLGRVESLLCRTSSLLSIDSSVIRYSRYSHMAEMAFSGSSHFAQRARSSLEGLTDLRKINLMVLLSR